MNFSNTQLFLIFAIILHSSIESEAVQCYQCSTDTDKKGEDLCGAYEYFDKERNIPIDCSDQDSHVPGSFCMKEVRQGPIGFIWDGRPRQVIRRCATTASTGVTGVCNWGVSMNLEYWEECYCSDDGCNGATTLSSSMAISIISGVILSVVYYFI